MSLKNVFGMFLGAIIGLLIVGFWRGEFDWSLSIAVLIGVPYGLCCISLNKEQSKKKCIEIKTLGFKS